jgi:hypothetical protein
MSDEAHWRVGRTVGRTIYRDDVLVALADTPAIAACLMAPRHTQGSGAMSGLWWFIGGFVVGIIFALWLVRRGAMDAVGRGLGW